MTRPRPGAKFKSPRDWPLEKRLEAYSIPEPNSGCLLWFGTTNGWGYGRLGWKGKVWQAQRLAWLSEYGEIPEGLQVLHRCDNPGCIEPKHLFLGTNADNIADKWAKGRGRTGYSQRRDGLSSRRAIIHERRTRCP